MEHDDRGGPERRKDREEPGALDEVARLAAAWCTTHLGRRPADRPVT